ncbi:MAG: hypothetical protein ACKOX6_11250 [Bdellovibrio sp.]
MTKVQKTVVTTVVLFVLQYAANANATTYLECKDESRTNCEEISKGQAVKKTSNDPKAIILKVDRMVFNEDSGNMKAKK